MRQLDAWETADKDLLRRLLARDPVRAAYLLGDLEDRYFDLCQWFVAGEPDPLPGAESVAGVVLVFSGLAETAVLSHGAPDAIAAAMKRCRRVLPHEFHAKIPLEHEAVWKQHFEIVGAEPMWSLGISAADYAAIDDRAGVRQLGPDDLTAMLALYQAYPDSFFEPAELDRGLYVGRHVGSELVAIAGTHVLSPTERIAVLGNLVTAPAHRGRGHARACTSELTERLIGLGCHTIALHVAAANISAICTYRRLGFAYFGTVLQARCRAQSA